LSNRLRKHARRHQPDALDPLPVGVPTDIGPANVEGVSTNFPRLDHVHAHPPGLGADLHHTPYWILVEKIEVTADTTTVTFLDLDLDAVGVYTLYFMLHNPLGELVIWRIFFNNDFVTTNYYYQRFHLSGASIYTSRYNDTVIGITEALTSIIGTCWFMRPPDGYPRMMELATRQTPAIICREEFIVARNIAENVTRIDIQADSTNGIGAGSKLWLFKMV